MSFTGFPAESFEFFAAVAEDTSWETVQARSELHESAVRAPMGALARELKPSSGRRRSTTSTARPTSGRSTPT